MKNFNGIHQKGVTFVEVIIASSILSLISLAVAPMFNVAQQGFTTSEAKISLRTESQKVINKIGHQLAESKRLFENTPASKAFLDRVQLTSPSTSLLGSRLPVLEETASLSPGSSLFVPTSVGNSLFFASRIEPKDLTILNSSAVNVTVRIDHYVFNYYFLGVDNSQEIGGQSKINLWEWHSVEYTDYTQMNGISDSTKRENAVQLLISSGVTHAFDPSATDVDSAFYTLETDGSISGDSAHAIVQDTASEMVDILTGMMGSGFKYGVSPNTGGTFTHLYTVPEFATASDNFPSGFEVVAVGPNSTRQIFLRLVLVSEGAFKGYISNGTTLLVTARDLW